MEERKIPKRISTVLLNSLSSGVVPGIGLEYIAVGRIREIEAILNDLENISDGGGAFRIITGRYGSGKSFFLKVIKNNAMEKGFVAADCDLSPERRFSGTKGQGVATYRELIKNLSTKTAPDGGALDIILQKWLFNIQNQVINGDGILPEAVEFGDAVKKKVYDVINSMEGLVHGFDFVKIILMYWSGCNIEDEEQRHNALRWLRAEFSTRLESRTQIGVNTIIDDENWYDYIKLIAEFTHQIGYKGFLIFIDEAVNLYKITNSVSRQNNYERILTIFNDIMQGKSKYLGFYMAGTTQFLEDERRGLYSYEALKSRLMENRFAKARGYDTMGAVIKLPVLTPEELFVLLHRLMSIHSQHYSYNSYLTDTQLESFLKIELGRIGADSMVTPREVTRDFIGLLNILFSEPDCTFDELLRDESNIFSKVENTVSDEFAEFEL